MKSKRPVQRNIRILDPVKIKIIAAIAAVAVIASIGLAIAASFSQVAKVAATITPGTEGCFALPIYKLPEPAINYPINVTDNTTGACLLYYPTDPNHPTCIERIGLFQKYTLGDCIENWRADKNRRFSFCPGKKCDSTETVTPLTVNMTRPYDTDCIAVNTPITFSAQASGSSANSYTYKWDFDGQDDSSPIVSGQTVSHTFTRAYQQNVVVTATPVGQSGQAVQTKSFFVKSTCTVTPPPIVTPPVTVQKYYRCNSTASCIAETSCQTGKKCYGATNDCTAQAGKDCAIAAASPAPTAATGCCLYYGIFGLTKFSAQLTQSQCTAKNRETFCGLGTTCNADKTCGPIAPTAPTAATTIDLCPNIAETQPSMPAGMLADSSGDCFTDQCLNVDGLQTSVPAGFTQTNKNCVETIMVSMSGIVKTNKNIALNNAGISAYLPNTNNIFSIYATARSGSNGKFTINNLPQSAKYGLKAAADGYLPVCQSLSAPSTGLNFTLYPIVLPGTDPGFDCAGGSRPPLRNEMQQGLLCLTDKMRNNPDILPQMTLKFTSFGRCSSATNGIDPNDCHDRGLAADFIPQLNGANYIGGNTTGNNIFNESCAAFQKLAESCGLKFIDERTKTDFVNSCGFAGTISADAHFHVAACNCTTGQTENCSNAINNYACNF